MFSYEDENIKIEVKREMTHEEILAITFWLFVINGIEVELPDLDLLEDQNDYYESLRDDDNL